MSYQFDPSAKNDVVRNAGFEPPDHASFKLNRLNQVKLINLRGSTSKLPADAEACRVVHVKQEGKLLLNAVKIKSA